VLCETTKQAANLSVQQDGARPKTGIPEMLEKEAIIAEISMQCHDEEIPRSSFCTASI
jgi:hypothetical protein